MKQVRLHGPHDLRLEDLPDPEPGPNDVVVAVQAFGICGSDLHFKRLGGITGPASRPIGIGHEFVGTVARVGSQVQGIDPGLRVVVDPLTHGHGIGVGAQEGAYAHFVRVANARLGGPLHALPDSLSTNRAVLTEPVAVATHAINRGEFPAGGRAVVFGAGPIGLAAVAVLRYRGAACITVVDLVDERLARARELGAHHTLNPQGIELGPALLQAMGRLKERGMVCADCDLFLDAAGAPGLLGTAVGLARPGGRTQIVLVAAANRAEPIELGTLLAREITLRGSLCYPTEFPQVLAMLQDPTFVIEPMVSHHFGFDDFHTAFATAEDPHASAKVVVHVAA